MAARARGMVRNGPTPTMFRMLVAQAAGRLNSRFSLGPSTGAGDAFTAGMLVEILRRAGRVEELQPGDLPALFTTANAVGALCTTRKGAIPALPDSRAVEEFLAAGCSKPL